MIYATLMCFLWSSLMRPKGILLAVLRSMEDSGVLRQALIASCYFSSMSNDQKIMLWHRRLGHLNLLYLKRLFPNLFDNKEHVDNFQCEACQLAKHYHATFKAQPYKSSKPFEMIHSDIWSLSRVKNSKWL